MAIKTIIFDFGNVIGFFSHRRALGSLLQHTAMTEDELRQRILHAELEDDFECGRITTENYIRLVRDLGQFTCPEDAIAHGLADMFWINEPVCKLIPQLRPRYRLLLGSNTNDLHYRFYCSMFADVVACFDHKIVSHEIGCRKPGREFFEHCQRFAHCAPEECVFIDDMTANIEGAVAFGWKGIVYRDYEGLVRDLHRLGVPIPPG